MIADYLGQVAPANRMELLRKSGMPERKAELVSVPFIDQASLRSSALSNFVDYWAYVHVFTGQIIANAPTVQSSEIEAETIFNGLSKKWYRETGMYSFIRQKATHRAYQQIIGMGKTALPFIFKELRKGKGDWMWALESITQENPVPERSTFKQSVEAWIHWGMDHGYAH